MNPALSPHTLQNPSSEYSNKFTRILTDDFPEEQYRRRKHEDKTLVHVGQRKLHMSEVEFLTHCCCELFNKKLKTDRIVLIYAGAAHGIHIPTLINMFPFVEYILIDPGKFNIDHSLYSNNVKCKIENCFMDNKKCESLYNDYKSHVRLFISDIRTSDVREKNEKDREDTILEDMKMQMEWYRILKPFKSMFKFRLPYVGKNKDAIREIEYLAGVPRFQLWAGCTSSETRLFVDEDAGKKMYDCVKYENQLFRFNTKERTLCYKHDIEAPGIDHCYDCYSEICIFEEYIKNFDKINSFCQNFKIEKKSVREYIVELTQNIRADMRLIKLIYKGELHYVPFKDMTYGKQAHEVFTDFTKSEQAEDIKNRYRKDANLSDSDSDNEFKNFGKRKLNFNDENTIRKQLKDNNYMKNILLQETNVSLHCLQSNNMRCETKNFDEELRILNESFSNEAILNYYDKESDLTTVFYKERGLRLIEIEFLTNVCNEIIKLRQLKFKLIVLIYAGSAPSIKLDLLHEMFPFIKFLLYDPKPFIDTKTSSMIEIRREYFNEEIALELVRTYKDYIRIFISNIKRAGNNDYSIESIQDEKDDLQLQMRCYENLKPFKSLLRFRIPKSNKTHEMNYLDGKLYLPLWSHYAANDTFLLVEKDASLKKYSFYNYRNQLHNFNKNERVKCYKHEVTSNGLDYCYDCRAEVYIIEKFIKSYNENFINDFKERTKKKLKLLNQDTKTYIDEFNVDIEANEKFYFFNFNKEKYKIRFTDYQFGSKLEDILKKSKYRLVKTYY